MVVLGVVEDRHLLVLLDNQEQTHYMVLLIMDLQVVLLFQLHQHMQQVVEVVQVVQVEMLQIHLHLEMVDPVEHQQLHMDHQIQ